MNCIIFNISQTIDRSIDRVELVEPRQPTKDVASQSGSRLAVPIEATNEHKSRNDFQYCISVESNRFLAKYDIRALSGGWVHHLGFLLNINSWSCLGGLLAVPSSTCLLAQQVIVALWIFSICWLFSSPSSFYRFYRFNSESANIHKQLIFDPCELGG